MRKTAYIKPQTTVEQVVSNQHLMANSWGTDGDHTPIIEGDPDDPLDSKGFGNLWEDDDDEWNSWDY